MTPNDSVTPKQSLCEVDERAAQESLRQLLRTQGADQSYIESQVQQLFDDGGFRSRFNYFMEFFDAAAKRHLLVSGTSIGTEMILAYEYGFERVTGTEVAPGLVDICKMRIADFPTAKAVYCQDDTLPFEDGEFSSVISGHIIEHTRSPFDYLREHMRVLQAGGYMFLEFPNRYHRTELHTNVPSLEWLPALLRKIIIVVLCSRLMPLSAQIKHRYNAILTTLQPVSRWQVWWWLKRSPGRARIEHYTVPAPGILRLIVRKLAA